MCIAISGRDNLSFKKIAPFIKATFPQTDYKVYVINKITKEPCIWFLGTMAGSSLVLLPKWGWNMPWKYVKYDTKIEYTNKYHAYKIQKTTLKGKSYMDIYEDTANKIEFPGFPNEDEARLILTHAVEGYYKTPNNEIKKYRIWHPKMAIKNAYCKRSYFHFLEELNILNYKEMQNPYSVLLCRAIDFTIYLPPHNIT